MHLRLQLLWLFQIISITYINSQTPMVINTWAFSNSTDKAWEFIKKGRSGIEALEAGCTVCEQLQCEGTVGYGGSPDENGETTLDSLIFDGTSMNMGAVGALRRVKNVISVARHVLEHTTHSLVVGELATQFAVDMGFDEESLTTKRSHKIWLNWRASSCQPNSWKNVEPNPEKECGPYKPMSENHINYENFKNIRHDVGSKNHDTIGMVVIDNDRNIIAGTSTNGMSHKIPGRVGDSPIPGAGAYADSEVGGSVATGDGDVMMRFLPSFLAVEEMRKGASPQDAAEEAIRRIVGKYPKFFGGVVAVNSKGEYGAACNGMDTFPFSVASNLEDVNVKSVVCNIK